MQDPKPSTTGHCIQPLHKSIYWAPNCTSLISFPFLVCYSVQTPIPGFWESVPVGGQVGTYMPASPPSLPGISQPRQEAPPYAICALCLSNTLGSASELCITALGPRLGCLAAPPSRSAEPQDTPRASPPLCSSSPWRKPLISWGDYFSSCPLKDEAQEARGRPFQRHHNGHLQPKPRFLLFLGSVEPLLETITIQLT